MDSNLEAPRDHPRLHLTAILRPSRSWVRFRVRGLSVGGCNFKLRLIMKGRMTAEVFGSLHCVTRYMAQPPQNPKSSSSLT